MNSLLRSLAILSTTLAGFGLATPAKAGALRAGLARVEITPTQPVLMAGYASRTNLSTGVHDPLSARALAFEQDGKRLLLVSLDNLGLYNSTAEPLRRAILEACHLQPAELLVGLRLPPPLPHSGGLYIKHSPRSTMDIATVGVASVVALTE